MSRRRGNNDEALTCIRNSVNFSPGRAGDAPGTDESRKGQMTRTELPPIGLIPAAGRGSRLGRLPFSKELMPIAVRGRDSTREIIVTALENAISMLVENDITCQHVVIAPGKRDIPTYLGDGARLESSVSYHVVDASPSVPHSLDAAYALTRGRDVVLVFPDIVFRPRTAVSAILRSRSRSDADVALALVPSERGDKVDFVSVGETDRVLSVTAKPGTGSRGWTWVTACWGERFTEFLHRYLQDPAESAAQSGGREIYVANVLNAAIGHGLQVQAVYFADGDAIDIGTPDDLAAIWANGLKE